MNEEEQNQIRAIQRYCLNDCKHGHREMVTACRNTECPLYPFKDIKHITEVCRKEINPRWEFDCGHCKFSWSCGPACSCVNNVKPNPDKQRWFLLTPVPGRWKSKHGGWSIAEVRYKKLVKGAKVDYRYGGRSLDGGTIRASSKWFKGVIAGMTNDWQGQEWGFEVLTIKEGVG